MKDEALKYSRLDLGTNHNLIENILIVNRYIGNLPLNAHKLLLSIACRQSGNILCFENARHYKAIVNVLNKSINSN